WLARAGRPRQPIGARTGPPRTGVGLRAVSRSPPVIRRREAAADLDGGRRDVTRPRGAAGRLVRLETVLRADLSGNADEQSHGLAAGRRRLDAAGARVTLGAGR